MASKSVLMNAFYDQVISFIGELNQMYPDDSDFSLYLTSIKMLKMTNPSMTVKAVYENTKPFEEAIMKKDETFFLERSYSEYSDVIDNVLFGKLKTYVANMDEPTKNIVWKYVHNIVKLSKACQ
jgi:hypothetical protein